MARDDWKIIWSSVLKDQRARWKSHLKKGTPTDTSLEHILCRSINDRTGDYVAMTAPGRNLEFTRFLLEHGVNPNINPLADFYPALYVAASNDNIETAELSIQYGARVNGQGALGATAKWKRYGMIEFLF